LKKNEEEREKSLQTFINEDRQKGFDLSKAPLFRLSLIQYTETDFYFIWSQHHILLDGWCLPVILEGIIKSYKAIKQGKEVEFIPRRPYRDYIAWLQKQDLKKAESFWKAYFQHLEGPTSISFKNIIEKDKDKDYDTYSTNFSSEESYIGIIDNCFCFIH